MGSKGEIKDQEVGGKFHTFSWKGYMLPYYVNDNSESLFDFQVNDDDIFVVSFPKSGTTWVQEIVYLIQSNLDFEAAKSATLEDRFPFLEYFNPGTKEIAKMEGPRLMKSHLPLSLLPPQIMEGKSKVIYIARNPKDAIVSSYHFLCMVAKYSYKGDISEFFEEWMSNKVPYSPWSEHVKEFWLSRHKENILFLTYEDMHKDLPCCIERISAFLKHPLTDTEVQNIAKHCGFDEMKTNSSVNYSWWDTSGIRNKAGTPFFRKGKVGDWESHYTSEMSHRVEQMCEEKLEPYGLKFNFNL